MRKISIAGLSVLFVLFTACKSGDKKSDDKLSADALKAKADSLYTAVIDEHDAGMVGWMKIEGRQTQINSLLDSIAKLPAKAQSSLADLKAKLNDANTALSNAYKEMDVWMQEMNLDSAANDLETRLRYLSDEKLKGSKITEMINSSVQKADSLLKVKF